MGAKVAAVVFMFVLAAPTWEQNAPGPTGMFCGGNQMVQYAHPVRATKLSGAVFDVLGAPLPGARVQVQIRGEETLLVDMTADNSGRFRLPKLRPGHYWLGVSADGFNLHVWDLRIVRLGWMKMLRPKLTIGT